MFFLLFVLWFSTGVLMLWGGYPEWSVEASLAARPVLPVRDFKIGVGRAWSALGLGEEPAAWEAGVKEGRPIYRFLHGRAWHAVDARTGKATSLLGPHGAINLAAGHKRGKPVGMRLLNVPDQWSVYGPAAKQGPLWRFVFDDGDYVYASAGGGQIVHHVTRSERVWAWCSSIPHWIYPVQLRRHTDAWVLTVEWLAGPAVFVALTGWIIGLWRWKKRTSPYAGFLRWHHLTGLIFGAFALLWIFSGWLSMGAWGLSSEQGIPQQLAMNWAKAGLFERQAFSPARLPAGDWRKISGHAIGGRWVYQAWDAQGTSKLFDENGSGYKMDIWPVETVAAEFLPKGDAYYYPTRWQDRELPVWRLQFANDPDRAYYASAASGRLLLSVGAKEKAVRWLYHGVHSWDLAFFRERPGLKIILMLPLLLGGLFLSGTGLVLAIRRFLR